MKKMLVVTACSVASALSADITLTGVTEYPVAQGDVMTISEKLTGTGAIRKTGAGELQLSGVGNDFTGGITVEGGAVRALSSGAFGTGPVTNNPGGRVIFDAEGGSFPNDYVQVGVYSVDYATCPLFFEKGGTFSGEFSSVDDRFYIATYRSTTSPDTAEGPTVNFMRKVASAPDTDFVSWIYGRLNFNGEFSSGQVSLAPAWSGNGVISLSSPGDTISEIKLYSGVVDCQAENVISNTTISWTQNSTGTIPGGLYKGSLYLNGKAQRIRSLSAENSTITQWPANGNGIYSSSPVTLTILGESSSRSTKCFVGNPVSILLDAAEYPDFVQEFNVRASATRGNIVVSNGTLRLASTAAFYNTPKIIVGPHGRFEQNSTYAQSLGGVTEINVDGSFITASGSVSGLSSEKEIVMRLGANSVLKLGSSETLTVKMLVVDGIPMAAGTYTVGGGIGQLQQGSIQVLGNDMSASWTGLGTTSIADSSSWSDPDVDVSMGNLIALFAEGGSTAVVDRPARFKSLRLKAASGETGFTFQSGAQDASFTLFGASIAVEDGSSDATLYDFGIPVWMRATATVAIPDASTVVFGAGLAADYSLDFTSGGAGTAIIRGSGDVVGAVKLSSTVLRVENGAITVPDHVSQGNATLNGSKTITLSTGGSGAETVLGLVVSNAVIEKPICMNAAIGTQPIRACAGSTNILSGHILEVGNWSGIYSGTDAEVILRGGYTSTTLPVIPMGPGRIRVQNAPVVATGSTGWLQRDGRLVLETAGNDFLYLCSGRDYAAYSPSIEFSVSGATTETTTLLNGCYYINPSFTPILDAGFSALMEFNATTQRVARFIGGSKGVCHGTWPARLEVVGHQGEFGDPVRIQASKYKVESAFTGGVGISMQGSGTLLFTGCVCTSTGSVEVTSGTLEFSTSARWPSPHDVTVAGTGELKLDAGARFGDATVLHVGDIGDDWVIAFPNGGEQKVDVMYDSNGRRMRHGCYGGSECALGSANKSLAGHFSGTGWIKVARHGNCLSIR